MLEDERQFDSTEVDGRLPQTERFFEEVKRWADAHEKQCGRFAKTLIFAVNDLPHTSHADQLVDIGRDVFGRGDSFRSEEGTDRKSWERAGAFRVYSDPADLLLHIRATRIAGKITEALE